jgi:hypothetical protein
MRLTPHDGHRVRARDGFNRMTPFKGFEHRQLTRLAKWSSITPIYQGKRCLSYNIGGGDGTRTPIEGCHLTIIEYARRNISGSADGTIAAASIPAASPHRRATASVNRKGTGPSVP